MSHATLSSDLSQLLSVAEAAGRIDGVEVQPRREDVPLSAAPGRRLAEQVVADRDYPPFDKALMDGFAARVGEPAGAFEVVGEVAAGDTWQGPPLTGRQAVAIMTGAPLPTAQGAVGIIPVERSRRIDEQRVALEIPPEPDRYITRRGGDRPAGATLLSAGTRLGPRHVAVLASVGMDSVPVFARPRCAVLATGNEIVPVDAAPGPGQIRNSNSPTLVTLLQGLGCDALDAGTVHDDLDALRHRLGEWLDTSCDALFITGGMSMGAHDHVPRVLEELGVILHVAKLKIKPGKPFVFGTRHRDSGFVCEGATARRGRHVTGVFGLPGNPVSAYVCTLVLAARLLTRLGGGSVQEAEARWTHLPLAQPVDANGPRQFYQPARRVKVDGQPAVQPLGWRGSADVFTLAEADLLLERPADDPPRPAGHPVRVLEVEGR